MAGREIQFGFDVLTVVVAFGVVVQFLFGELPLEFDVVAVLELVFDPLARTVAGGVDERGVGADSQHLVFVNGPSGSAVSVAIPISVTIATVDIDCRAASEAGCRNRRPGRKKRASSHHSVVAPGGT